MSRADVGLLGGVPHQGCAARRDQGVQAWTVGRRSGGGEPRLDQCAQPVGADASGRDRQDGGDGGAGVHPHRVQLVAARHRPGRAGSGGEDEHALRVGDLEVAGAGVGAHQVVADVGSERRGSAAKGLVHGSGESGRGLESLVGRCGVRGREQHRVALAQDRQRRAGVTLHRGAHETDGVAAPRGSLGVRAAQGHESLGDLVCRGHPAEGRQRGGDVGHQALARR